MNQQEIAKRIFNTAKQGKVVQLKPETAKQIALWLMESMEPQFQDRHANIDLYAEGSCVYRMKRDGSGIMDLAAWAANATVARAAFNELHRTYPNDHFVQRRKAHVEADTKEPPGNAYAKTKGV